MKRYEENGSVNPDGYIHGGWDRIHARDDWAFHQFCIISPKHSNPLDKTAP